MMAGARRGEAHLHTWPAAVQAARRVVAAAETAILRAHVEGDHFALAQLRPRRRAAVERLEAAKRAVLAGGDA